MPLKNLGSAGNSVDARLQAQQQARKTTETLGKLPSTSTSTKPAVDAQQPGRFTGETSTKTPGSITAAHQRVLGDVGVGGPGGSKKTQSAALKGATTGLRFFDHGVGKTLKRGVLGALAGITLLGAVAADKIASAPKIDHGVFTRASIVDTRVTNKQVGGQKALADAQAVVARWEQEKARDPSFTVTKDRATELLLAALLPARPGPSDDVAKFAKANMGGDTKHLVLGLLDGNAFTLDADAKLLFETAADRLLVSSDGKLKIVGDQSGGDGKLRLEGVAGAQIEALNLSTIPTKRIMTGETFVVGTVGQDGKFEGDLAMRAGDQVKVRLKLADGTTTDWVQFRASGLGQDTRNAEAALFRIGLSDAGNGVINVSNINSSRTISEPGAVMRFVNTRTNESTDVKINALGSFDTGTKLPGAPGDQFSVRVTDGVNDTALSVEIGKVKVGTGRGGSQVHDFDLPDPGLHRDELDETGKPKFSLERFRGPLFDVDGAKATDVTQGQIGDCYLPAAVAAIAHHRPGHFENMIKQKIEIDENTGVEKVWFEVTFQERGWENGKTVFKPVVQSVDADLFVRSWGGPLYGADDGNRSIEDMELWWPILEKAYADWKGDYNTIGDGGHVSNVFRDMLGEETGSMSIGGMWGSSTPDQIWKKIVENVDAKRPIGAGTHGHDQDAIYANTGVYSNHAYSILAYEEAADGTRYVQVRNPWGESEPFPGDGKNDGIFKLKLDDFMKLYSNLYFVEGD